MLRPLLIAICSLACILSSARADDPPASPPAAPLTAPDAAPTLPDTPAGRALGKFLTAFNNADAPQLDEQDFAPEFLKAVPLDKFRGLTTTLRAQLGTLTLRRIEPGATDTRLVAIARAEKPGTSIRIPISTDDKGVIDGLRIAPAADEDTPPLKSWDELDERLKPLAESVSFAAYSFAPTGGTWPPTLLANPAHKLDAEHPLAVGSTFKLYVLAALAAKIDRGEAAWDTELSINDKIKSLPSGVMQNEKQGAKFPIREFALKMISISDNTATDHLMHFVGRDAIETTFNLGAADEKFGGIAWNAGDSPTLADNAAKRDLTLPFLTTREMFAIKLAQDRTLVDRYAKAITDMRRGMLAPPPDDGSIEKKAGEVYAIEPNLAMAAFWTKPVAIDRVEWFISTREACRLMIALNLMSMSRDGKLSALNDILGANPGIPLNPKTWKRFYYKGGSEPGVLNLTWLLEHADGRTFVLSMTLNDTRKAIKDDQAIGLAARAIELLAAQPK